MNAFEKWWRAQTLKGDPLRNTNLVRDAFYAGVEAGRKEAKDEARDAVTEERWRVHQGEDYGSF
jgi:hypothetical protein